MFCSKCGSKQPDDAAYCWKCGSQLGLTPLSAEEAVSTATASPSTSAAPQEEPGYTATYDDPHQTGQARADNKKRPLRIGIISVFALVVLGAGSYAIFSAMRSGTAASQALSGSRLSLPGISLEPPKDWTSFPVSESGTLVMAPPGATNNCPNTPSGGPARCIEAVTVSRTESANLNASSPANADQQLVNGRFSALHADIQRTTTLAQKSFTADGCPAYSSEWRVTWTKPPDTIEDWVAVRTKTPYKNSYLASVFIRLTAQNAASAQTLANDVVSSIKCS
jgi:hypothetical protein